MEINVGDPVILKDAKGLKKYGLHKGMTGTCNAFSVIPGDKDYIHFMPEGAMKVFIVEAKRLILDEEKFLQMKKEEEEDSSNA